MSAEAAAVLTQQFTELKITFHSVQKKWIHFVSQERSREREGKKPLYNFTLPKSLARRVILRMKQGLLRTCHSSARSCFAEAIALHPQGTGNTFGTSLWFAVVEL